MMSEDNNKFDWVFKYPKIKHLYERDDDYKLKLDSISEPEFDSIKKWTITEKMNGTNFRACYDGYSNNHLILGKTEDSEIHDFVKDFFDDFIDKNRLIVMAKLFKDKRVIIFGELIGDKINKNKYKLPLHDFVVFDIWISGYWLERQSVLDICNKLSFSVVPFVNVMRDATEINILMEKELTSSYALSDQTLREGYVCRASPTMLFRNGNPIMFKAVAKDWRKFK